MSYGRHVNERSLQAALHTALRRGAHLGIGLGAFTPLLALANPSGGQVVGGQASVTTVGSNGLVVNQTTQSAIINWQQFSIGTGEYVQFVQPNSSSVILNRVIGGSPSSILGNLTANGQVFLVNPNGVFFGHGSTLDAQGFLASTLNISDSNFLSGNYVFDQPGAAGAQVVNQGTLQAHSGGYVVLAGDYASNTGIISAQAGHVILASGAKTTLGLSGNSLVSFVVNQATLAQYAGVANAGTLSADGGTVIMTADVANALKATVVNNSGLVEAHAISNAGGVIQLTATGGNIENSGTLDASATSSGVQGGDVTLKGDGLTALTSTSKIYATGDGADGGHLEVSGNTIAIRGIEKLGQGGDFLIDPNHITLVAGSGGASHLASHGTGGNSSVTVGINTIETQLNSGVAVSVSAHTLITETGVTSITATGTGTLKLKTPGTIGLSGVDITIKGALQASFGYGSFGHLQAAGIFLKGSQVILPGATLDSHGNVTKWSAVASNGNLSIQGFVAGTGVLALENTTVGDGINLAASIGSANAHHAGGVIIKAAKIDSPNLKIVANGKVDITASNGYASLGALAASKSIDVTVHGHGGALNLDGTIKAGKGVTIVQSHGSIVDAHAISAGSGGISITNSDGKTSLQALKGPGIVLTEKGHGAALKVSGLIQPSGNAMTITQSSGAISIGNVSNSQIHITDNLGNIKTGRMVGETITVTAVHGTMSVGGATAEGGVITFTDNAFGAGALKINGGITNYGHKIIIVQSSGSIVDTHPILGSSNGGSIAVTNDHGKTSLGSLIAHNGITVTEKGAGAGLFLNGPITAGGNVTITQSHGGLIAHAISATGGNISVTNSNGYAVFFGGLTAHNSITVTDKAHGSSGLRISGAVKARGVTLTESHGVLITHNVTASSGYAIGITDSNGHMSLGALSAGGKVVVKDNAHGVGGLNITGAITAHGHASVTQSSGQFHDSHAITTHTNGGSHGSITINITGSNGYATVGALTAIDGNVTVAAHGKGNGTLKIVGAVQANGGTATITQSHGGLKTGNITATSGGAVNIANSNGYASLGALWASSGAVDVTVKGHGAALKLSGKVTALGAVTLTQSSGSMLAHSISAGGVTITNSHGKTSIAGGVNAGGAVTITQNSKKGGAEQLKVTGTIHAGGAINVTQNSGSIVAAAMSAEGGGLINLTNDKGETTVGALNASGIVTITEKGGTGGSGLNINGTIHAHGNVTITQSHGGISDQHAITASNGGNISITNSNGYANLGALTAGGSITVTDKGHGAQLAISGAAKAHGNVSITQSHGNLSAVGISASHGNISVTNSDGYAGMGALTAAGTVTVTAKGHGAALEVFGNINAGGAVTLTQSSGAISAHDMIAGNSGNIKVTDTKGNIKTGSIITAGTASVDAIAGAYTLRGGGSGTVSGHKGVKLTASQINDMGSVEAGVAIHAASGAVTVKGVFGPSGEGFGHAIAITAGGKITVDHSIKARSIDVAGSALLFTGTGHNFSLDAAGGNLVLDAPIGTALAPVKLDVNLEDSGGGIYVQRSIYTGTTAGHAKANIDIAQTFVGGHSILQGVIIGSPGGKPLTLSAKGSITVTGANIGVGDIFQGGTMFPSLQGMGGVTFKAATISLTAVGSSRVDLQACKLEYSIVSPK